MAPNATTARALLHEARVVLTYIIAAAAIGTGLALASEVHAAPVNLAREG